MLLQFRSNGIRTQRLFEDPVERIEGQGEDMVKENVSSNPSESWSNDSASNGQFSVLSKNNGEL